MEAAARLYTSGLLDPYVNAEDRSLLTRAGALAQLWREKAPGYFDVKESNETARKAVRAYAAALHVPAGAARGGGGGRRRGGAGRPARRAGGPGPRAGGRAPAGAGPGRRARRGR